MRLALQDLALASIANTAASTRDSLGRAFAAPSCLARSLRFGFAADRHLASILTLDRNILLVDRIVERIVVVRRIPLPLCHLSALRCQGKG